MVALHQGVGRSTAMAQTCLLLCFALVIVWIKILLYLTALFYFDSETISAALADFVFWGRRLKKVARFFWGKKCIWVTWLEDVLTSKWPGSFAALAPPLDQWPRPKPKSQGQGLTKWVKFNIPLDTYCNQSFWRRVFPGSQLHWYWQQQQSRENTYENTENLILRQNDNS